MGESKKVAFSTINSDLNDSGKSKQKKALRLTLSLVESNDKSYSEFDYRELVTQHFKKRFKKPTSILNGPILDPKDPFGGPDDDDAALQELARSYEKKYGNTKKKKYKDLGAGYDDTDPFIDNSDMVSDYVPKNKEAKYGGFYVNAGALCFKEVPKSEESDEDDDEIKETRPYKKRKKILSSDDEEEDREPKKIKANGVIPMKKTKKMDEGELLRHRKKLISKFNKKSKHVSLKEDKSSQGTSSKPLAPSVETSIAASIESVVTKAREAADLDVPMQANDEVLSANDPESSSSSSSSSGLSSSAGSSSSDSDSDEDPDTPKDDQRPENSHKDNTEDACRTISSDAEEMSLPTNLPSDLIDVLEKIKEAGRVSKGSSQKFFTDPSVNKMLLTIEIKLRSFAGRKKTRIYKHLAQHLPCGNQTLIKRAKNLLCDKLDEKLKQPLTHLAEIVHQMMPSLQDQYKQECQKVAQSSQHYYELLNSYWNDSDQNGDDSKKKNIPKRKFLFTSETKNYLLDAVKIRCEGYNMIKKRNQSLEEHIRLYLEEEVRPIWPKGWMSTKILYKESESVLKPFLKNELPMTEKKPLVSTPSGKQIPVKYESPVRIDLKPQEKKSVIVTPVTEMEKKPMKIPEPMDVHKILKIQKEYLESPKSDFDHRNLEKKIPPKQDFDHKVMEKKVPPKQDFDHKVMETKAPPKQDFDHKLVENMIPTKLDFDHRNMEKKVTQKPDYDHRTMEKKIPTKVDFDHRNIEKKIPPKPDFDHRNMEKKVPPKPDFDHRNMEKKIPPKPDFDHKNMEKRAYRKPDDIRLDDMKRPPKPSLSATVIPKKDEKSPIMIRSVDKINEGLHSRLESVEAVDLSKDSPSHKKDASDPLDNKLAKDMADVMNDLLQISKQKLCESPETLSDTGTMRILNQIDKFEGTVEPKVSQGSHDGYRPKKMFTPEDLHKVAKYNESRQEKSRHIPHTMVTSYLPAKPDKIQTHPPKTHSVISHCSSYSKPSLIDTCISSIINPESRDGSRQSSHTIQSVSKSHLGTRNFTPTSSIPGLPQVSLMPSTRTPQHWKNEVLARSTSSNQVNSSAPHDPLSNLRMMQGINVSSISQHKPSNIEQRSAPMSSHNYAPSIREINTPHPKLKQSRPENYISHNLLPNMNVNDLRLHKDSVGRPQLWQGNTSYVSKNSESSRNELGNFHNNTPVSKTNKY